MEGWISGIIISVVSGFIVYFATNFIGKRKDNKVYIEKLNNANYELVHSIKPLVLEKEGLNIKFIDSILNSISSKYGVIKGDMLKTVDVIDKLITEISQSFFLTNDQKKDHINSLLKIRDTISTKIKDKKQVSQVKVASSDKSHMSILLAAITFGYILVSLNLSEIFFTLNTPYSFDSMLGLIITATIIPIVMFSFLQYIKLKRESIDRERRMKRMKMVYKNLNNLDT